MTNLVASTDPVLPYPEAMVDYASSLTFELRHGGSGSSGYDVRLGFRNGSSADGDLTYYPMFGTSDVDIDLSTFVSNLQVRVKKSAERVVSLFDGGSRRAFFPSFVP
jgi:prostatic aicd phosphatase